MNKNDRLKVYLVGGALRDEYLAQPVSDRDWVVVGATPKDMQELGYRQVGKDFPVFLHPESQEEYALARRERKTAPGHQGFAFDTEASVTIEEDLLRRDLTINAIARAHDGSVVDPYGGRADLDARILRHVSPAFTEDPLRVLRVARFAARLKPLGFTVADETAQLLATISHSGELSTLPAERVWTEFQRSLTCSNPMPFITTLRDCGALSALFPELNNLYGIPQVAEYHPEIDCGIHNEMVLQQICNLTEDPVTRFAALCHDLGKATTPTDLLPSHHGHEERGAEITSQFARRLRIPNDYKDLAVLTARFHSHCHRAFELKATTILKLLSSLDAMRRPERFKRYLQVCEADARGRKGFEHRDYPQAGYLHNCLLSVQRLDVAAIAINAKQSEQDVAQSIRDARLAALKEFIRQQA